MSVQDTATPTEDTSVDAVDTSTNEDTQDTDVELEDIEVDLDESSRDDETEESSESDEDKSANESTKEELEESAEDAKDKDADGEDTDPEAERKRHNAEMAQRRIAEREAREKAKNDAQQKYLDEAEDPRDLALRQLQVDAYNNRIQTNTNTLQNGIDKAVASIDLLRTGTPEVKEELANALDDFERMYVVRDRNGDPVEVRGDVFEFLQNKADSIRRLTGVGARQQQKDKDKTKSRTLSAPNRTPKEPKEDPDLAAFDAEWDKYDN